MCTHAHHLAESRKAPGLSVLIVCDGSILIRDTRHRDPLRPAGLIRYVPAGATVPPVDCLAGGFSEGQRTAADFLEYMTRESAERLADAIPRPAILR